MTKRRNRISTLLLLSEVVSAFIEFLVFGIAPWYGLSRLADFFDSTMHTIFIEILILVLIFILFWPCLALSLVTLIRLHTCIENFRVKRILSNNFEVVNLRPKKYNEFKSKCNFNLLCCYAKIDESNTITCVVEVSLHDAYNGDSYLYEFQVDNGWFIKNFKC